jgi:hypothetical protein
MKYFSEQFNLPPGFGVRQSSGAFRDVKSGIPLRKATVGQGGLPQSRTLSRLSESNR